MMHGKILNVEQIRKLDAYTIENEPIKSIDLMERASMSFVKWFTAHFDSENSVCIFVGLGNNGGDGLAIARLLALAEYKVELFVVRYSENTTEDFRVNYERLPQVVNKKEVYSKDDLTLLDLNTADQSRVLIDALLGSGLKKEPEGLLEEVISYINRSKFQIVSVDIASGLYADKPTLHNSVVNPDYTVAFQIPKLAFLVPENSKRVGNWNLVDIGLSSEFIQKEKTNQYLINKTFIKTIYKKREKFSHKGNFGRALLIAGSFGKMGAAILAANACLRAGVGLLTLQVPRCGIEILQSTTPEAMVITGKSKKSIEPIDWENLQIDSIGIGPGIGTNSKALACLGNILQETKFPMVIDADALNLLAANKDLLKIVPPNSILTPHLKEFERLFGESGNHFSRLDLLRAMAVDYKLNIILKGAHTAIATPSGDIFFNTTGNPGMATGGSGDVLTGILTSLLAQGYSPLDASLLGVYIHGLAGDIASKETGQESLIASDIISNLGKAFLTMNSL